MKGQSIVHQIQQNPNFHEMLNSDQDINRLFFIQRRVHFETGATLLERTEKEYHTSIIVASNIEEAQDFYEQTIQDDVAQARAEYWHAPAILKFNETPLVKVRERLIAWEPLLEADGVLIIRPGYFTPLEFDEPVLCFQPQYAPKDHRHQFRIQIYAEKDLNEAQMRLEEAGGSIHQVMICRCIPGYIADIMPPVFH